MPIVHFSRLAESDLLTIGSYTLQTWGEAQTFRYLIEMEIACQQLADNPGLGRACENIRPGLHRCEYGRHVIFFRREDEGILISRILHQRMSPGLHPFES